MRSYRELWLWLGAAWLTLATILAAIALAYFTKEKYFSLYTSWQMLLGIATFVFAFICFLGGIVGWPFPPWTKLGFPDIKVNIYGAGDARTERKLMPDWGVPASLFLYRARITNMEKEQNASLTIRLYLKLVPGSSGLVGEMLSTPVDWAIDPLLGFDPLPQTIDLSPGTTANGDLVYELSKIYDGKIAIPRRARLVIEDHVSGKKMEKVLEGDLARFTRKDMRPTGGGIEILESGQNSEPASLGDGETSTAPDETPPSS